MPSKKRIAVALLGAAMGLLILIQGLFIALPQIAGYLISSRISGFPRGFDPSFTIEAVGLRKAIIGDIRLGRDIRADSVEIFYAWQTDLPFRVTKIRISGLDLHGGIDKTYNFSLNGEGLLLQNPKVPNNNENVTTAADPIFPLSKAQFRSLAPFIPGQVVIEHSRLRLDIKGQSIEIPFTARAVLDSQTAAAKGYAIVSAFGQQVTITARADLEKGIRQLGIEGRALSPACLVERIAPGTLPVAFTGPVDLGATMSETGGWQFSLSGLGVKGAAGPDLRLGNGTGSFDPESRNLVFSGELTAREIATHPLAMDLKLTGRLAENTPFDLTLESRPVDAVELDKEQLPGTSREQFDALQATRPQFRLHLTGDRQLQKVAIHLSSEQVKAEFPDKMKFSADRLTITAESQGSLFASPLSQEISWGISTGKFDLGPVAKTPEPLSISGKLTGSGRIRLDPEASLKTGSAQVSLVISDLLGRMGQDRFTVGSARLSGQTTGSASHHQVGLSAKLAPVTLSLNGGGLTIPGCGLTGRLTVFGDKPPVVDLTAWADNAELAYPEEAITVRGLALKSRFTRPFIPGPPGHISVQTIIYQNRLKAAFSSELMQVDENTFRLTGTLSSPDLINKELEINVKAGIMPEPWADFHAASRHFTISRKSVSTLAPQITLPGEVDLDTTVDVWAGYRYGRFTSRAALEVHDGSISLPDLNLSATGITGLLGMRDLMKMESYPGQLLNIDRITLGQFSFEKAALRFRIEDRQSMGIENLRFNWCNGLVSSEALQLPAKDGNPQLILFCDRLEMDELLNQLGAFDARGGGTLSGRIPVTYQEGGLSFENGFLFSTPGRGGNIAVRDLDRLMAGFPKGTAESSYLEMAQEALKDFQYNWATLKMNTIGDTLTVNMELDGKPARILPFEFRRDTNAFVRVDAKSPGARFQGIKLDLNLKLPFNQMAKFGNKIKRLME